MKNKKVRKVRLFVTIRCRPEVTADVWICKGHCSYTVFIIANNSKDLFSTLLLEKSWTIKNIKSQIFKDRKWRPKYWSMIFLQTLFIVWDLKISSKSTKAFLRKRNRKKKTRSDLVSSNGRSSVWMQLKIGYRDNFSFLSFHNTSYKFSLTLSNNFNRQIIILKKDIILIFNRILNRKFVKFLISKIKSKLEHN